MSVFEPDGAPRVLNSSHSARDEHLTSSVFCTNDLPLIRPVLVTTRREQLKPSFSRSLTTSSAPPDLSHETMKHTEYHLSDVCERQSSAKVAPSSRAIGNSLSS